MTNNFRVFVALVGLGGFILIGLSLRSDPATRSSSSIAEIDSVVPSTAIASRGPALEVRGNPVPLALRTRSPASPPTSSDEMPSSVEAETQSRAQEELDRRAAKAAAEVDGYKRVSILGKASNGGWRVRGYRGSTEVLLTVDGSGRVSMD